MDEDYFHGFLVKEWAAWGTDVPLMRKVPGLEELVLEAW